MNDLISREEAFEAVYQGLRRPSNDPAWIRICNELKNVPSAQQWIPVTERLPEFEKLVLAWVENKNPNGRFNRPGIHTAQLKDKKPEHDPEGKKNIWGIPGYDSEWTVWAWSYFSEPDVKAWMPLPEPYKEEKQ